VARQLRVVLPLLIVAALAEGRNANAQVATSEATVTTGVSTDHVRVGATQVRTFGEFRGWHFYGDGSFTTRRGRAESDAFGAAYPYEPKASLLELKVERTHIKGERLLGIRLGRYRTPFGIYSAGDQGYVGFSRAPLIRNSYYWAISNNYLDTGASVVAGTTWLSAEASAGIASDQDYFARPGGLNGVIRVQGSTGPLIAGVSYMRTRPSRNWEYAPGFATFTGVDLRWMTSGVQLRGEWLTGEPFTGAKANGGYADMLVHKPRMGPVTAVARIERLDYIADAEYSELSRRYTLGARVRMTRGLSAQINYVRQPNAEYYGSRPNAVDFSLSYTIRTASWLDRRSQ
jgi:hypothetical protein